MQFDGQTPGSPERPIILCVDDDPSILEALHGVLQRALGGQALIEVAASGPEAIEVVDDALEDGLSVAVIVSDEIMPEMRGHQLLQRLATLVPEARAILLTGQASSTDVGLAVNTGILEGFMRKPWSNTELAITVRSALERWLQARELVQTRRMMEFLLSGDPSAVIMLDASNQPTRWNPAAEALVASIPGDADLTAVPGSVLESLQREAAQNPGRSGQRLTGSIEEWASLVGDGATYVQQAVYGPGPDGSWVYRLTDVTDSIRTSQALERSLASDGERQRIAALGMMTGAMVHELNNYLFVIGSTAELLAAEHVAEPALLTDLGQAVEQAGLMAGQMMAFVRNDPLESEIFEVTPVVNQAVAFGRRFAAAEAQIEVFAPTDPVWTECASMHLQQIVLNLIKNALDAAGDTPARIEVSVLPGDPLVVRVRDHGPGIPAAVIEQLFAPFVTTKATGSGTGIGLTISRRLARMHGGDLRYVEPDGAGAVFEIQIPVAADDPENLLPGAAPRPSGSNVLLSRSILLLEDHPRARQLMERQLKSLGAKTVHGVSSVRDFERWLTTNRESPPDLVVSDMMLPDGAWPEIVSALAGAKLTVPILFVSGHSSQEFVERLPLENPRAFLSKPFTRPVLGRVLASLLAGT